MLVINWDTVTADITEHRSNENREICQSFSKLVSFVVSIHWHWGISPNKTLHRLYKDRHTHTEKDWNGVEMTINNGISSKTLKQEANSRNLPPYYITRPQVFNSHTSKHINTYLDKHTHTCMFTHKHMRYSASQFCLTAPGSWQCLNPDLVTFKWVQRGRGRF